METQNVSAQLYFKQLPMDPNSGKYGCNNSGDFESTCVNDIDTDTQIENAFQSQLDTSEYYKTPGVFNAIKRDYIDKTLGNLETPENIETPFVPVQKSIPANPWTSKSSFGASGMSGLEIFFTILGILCVITLIYFLYKKYIKK